MKRLIIIVLLSPLFLHAQRSENDTLKIKANLSLTGFWQRGNVQTSIFRGKTDLTIRPWSKWVYNNTNSYVYQAFGGQKADEDILSLNFLSFNPDARFYPLVLAFFSTNYRREIDRRYLIGGGATFQVYEKAKSVLKLSLTLEYENTEYEKSNFNLDAFDGQSSISMVRNTLWVYGKHYFFDKKVILSHESYLQPSFNSPYNYRWRAEIGVELPIWKFLNFKATYIDTFESLVVANQRQEDKFLTFGFSLKSY